MTDSSSAVRAGVRRLLAGAAAALALAFAASHPAVAAPRGEARPAASAAHHDETLLRSLYGSENRTIRTTAPVAALTFNAAWNDRGLDEVLATLDRYRVPATFFLTGRLSERFPDAARRIAVAGHGLGNHSHTHPYFRNLSAAGREYEVLAADRAIRAASGAVPLPFFRFPYGETRVGHIAEVNALGFATVEFTNDTLGYLGPAGGVTADKVVQRAVDSLRPGTILQMHVGTATGTGPVLDAEALPRIIEAYRSRGYRIMDLRELVGL